STVSGAMDRNSQTIQPAMASSPKRATAKTLAAGGMLVMRNVTTLAAGLGPRNGTANIAVKNRKTAPQPSHSRPKPSKQTTTPTHTRRNTRKHTKDDPRYMSGTIIVAPERESRT